MAEQPPPPYSGTDPEEAQLAQEGRLPSAPPTDAQHASSEVYPPQYSALSYSPPPADAEGQPPNPPAAQGPPAGAMGYPTTSKPPSSVPAVSYFPDFNYRGY